MTVMGITETIYVGEELDGQNLQFTTRKELMKKHRIYVKRRNSISCIMLSLLNTESYSGWCPATSAIIKLKYVEPFAHMPFTHVPVKHLTIPNIGEDDLKSENEDRYGNQGIEIKNKVFSFSEYGGDAYYPNGSYDINWNLFDKTPRYKDKRVVYVLTGESGIGKTYLANHLKGNEVYETDMATTLPECIYADVVVLGNRSAFTIEQVKEKIFQPADIVICTMTKLDDLRCVI